MEIKIAVEAGGLGDALNQFKSRFPLFVRKGLVDAGSILHQLSLKKLSEQVYNIKIPTVLRRSRKTGRVRSVKLWKRTSDLYRAEGTGAQMALHEYKYILSNNSPYAWRRHQLKYPAKTKFTTLDGRGKNAKYIHLPRLDRTAHWRADAWKEGMPQMHKAFRNAVKVLRQTP